jgi:uncharacterized protein
MLIEFRVENHRSLRDEQVLTMEAGRLGDEDDLRPRRVSGYAECLLPVAVLYGANASGKSNVLAALAYMRDVVVMSHSIWSPNQGVPRDPFAWGPKRDEPSLFEASFLAGDVRYQYGFIATDERFLEEWLHAWPKGKKQAWFEREGDAFKFGEHLKGENKLIEGVTRDNALFLSAAAQHRHPQLTPIFSWFRAIEAVNLPAGQQFLTPGLSPDFRLRSRIGGEQGAWLQKLSAGGDGGEPLLDRIQPLLRNADLGIVDLALGKEDTDALGRVSRSRGILLKHEGPYQDAWLPLGEESRGTQALFRLAVPLLFALDEGGILLVDELEASLHPLLAQQIVRQFHEPATNPRNAQLIFTTQDTNLLGTMMDGPALRRDQMWFTEKDAEGATTLYPLTDFKPRKAENIERGYLQGRYGAIPFLGDFHLVGGSPAAAKE